jgi:hypothetical protein
MVLIMLIFVVFAVAANNIQQIGEKPLSIHPLLNSA